MKFSIQTESLKVENNVRKADDTPFVDEEKKEASKYLGYGFDVTSTKSILDPNNSVKLKAPILDVKSSELQDKIQMFKTSNSTAVNYVSKSRKNISESIGKVYSGSLGVSASLTNIGPISSVKADLNAAFDRSSTSSWSTTMKEEYSVYEMVVKTEPSLFPWMKSKTN